VRQEDDGSITVGITDHAQELLGDLVFVELPETGSVMAADEACCVVESVKAASDVYMPLSGEIFEVNDLLNDTPELINDSPYDDGWLFRLTPSELHELEELMDAEDYQAEIEE
jgi:glycine cleavage system H protein